MNDRYAAVPVKQLEKMEEFVYGIIPCDGHSVEQIESLIDELNTAIDSAVEPEVWHDTDHFPYGEAFSPDKESARGYMNYPVPYIPCPTKESE